MYSFVPSLVTVTTNLLKLSYHFELVVFCTFSNPLAILRQKLSGPNLDIALSILSSLSARHFFSQTKVRQHALKWLICSLEKSLKIHLSYCLFN